MFKRLAITHSSSITGLFPNLPSSASFLFTSMLPYFTFFPPFFNYSNRCFFHYSISSRNFLSLVSSTSFKGARVKGSRSSLSRCLLMLTLSTYWPPGSLIGSFISWMMINVLCWEAGKDIYQGFLHISLHSPLHSMQLIIFLSDLQIFQGYRWQYNVRC